VGHSEARLLRELSDNMSKAVICPICGGSGKIEQPECTEAVRPCHGCSGRGWVEIGQAGPVWPESASEFYEPQKHESATSIYDSPTSIYESHTARTGDLLPDWGPN